MRLSVLFSLLLLTPTLAFATEYEQRCSLSADMQALKDKLGEGITATMRDYFERKHLEVATIDPYNFTIFDEDPLEGLQVIAKTRVTLKSGEQYDILLPDDNLESGAVLGYSTGPVLADGRHYDIHCGGEFGLAYILKPGTNKIVGEFDLRRLEIYSRPLSNQGNKADVDLFVKMLVGSSSDFTILGQDGLSSAGKNCHLWVIKDNESVILGLGDDATYVDFRMDLDAVVSANVSLTNPDGKHVQATQAYKGLQGGDPFAEAVSFAINGLPTSPVPNNVAKMSITRGDQTLQCEFKN